MMQNPNVYAPPQGPTGYGQQQAMVHQGYQQVVPHALAHPTFLVKRPFWSFLGRKFHVYAPDGSLVAFVKHPLLKLREQFTIFQDESQTRPMLFIKARQLIGFNICFDVADAASGQRVGTIRRRGLKSMFRDTFEILDPHDQPVGVCEEEGAALLRRLVPMLPGKWKIELHGQVVGRIDQIFRFFLKEFTLDLSMNHNRLDPRFAMALAIFALMQESARESRG